MAAEIGEMELIEAYKKGDERAGNQLFENNKKLIHFIYERHFKLSGCPQEDLFQEGCLGLFEAIRKFDPLQKDRFASYKSLLIRAKMYGFRHKFFKIVAEPLGDEHLKIPSVPSSYEKMNYLIFELDNLVGSGKMSKSKATQVLTKIIKGTR